MKSLRVVVFVFCLSSLASFTGCVGPMACAPLGGGCGSCDSCNGCGEVYIDPWINHPADQCDPCDCCGNYNGQSCGRCRPMFSGVTSLWGYKQDGCDGGCDSCGGGGCGCEVGCGADVGCGCGTEAGCGLEGGHEVGGGGCASCSGGDHYSAIRYRGDHAHGEPTIAEGQAIQNSSVAHSYQPQHTRKIFNPKSNVASKPTRPAY